MLTLAQYNLAVLVNDMAERDRARALFEITIRSTTGAAALLPSLRVSSKNRHAVLLRLDLATGAVWVRRL
eukprot:COSAG06_NODE_4602_length_4107_cov_5.619356_3_plen_70_part_00